MKKVELNDLRQEILVAAPLRGLLALRDKARQQLVDVELALEGMAQALSQRQVERDKAMSEYKAAKREGRCVKECLAKFMDATLAQDDDSKTLSKLSESLRRSRVACERYSSELRETVKTCVLTSSFVRGLVHQMYRDIAE